MSASNLPMIDVDRLQPGIYVVLDLGWRNHPFLRSSFTIRQQEQIDQIRGLGLRQVRYSPERSSAEPLDLPPPPAPAIAPVEVDRSAAAPAATAVTAVTADIDESIGFFDTAVSSAAMHPSGVAAALQAGVEPVTLERWQEISLQRIEHNYNAATQQRQQLLKQLASEPLRARQTAVQLGDSLCRAVIECEQPSVRLLSDQVGQQGADHEVGVAALAVLLGQAHGMETSALRELALAALLHDVGKTRIPSFLHEDTGKLTEFERRSYRQHVPLGIELLQALSLPQAVLRAIEEHHERHDGSGFPAGLKGERISLNGRVLAICNRYMNLICPKRVETGVTPHQALKQMYGDERSHFDPTLLQRFIRLLGVYPPGTLVELSDQRMAVVVGSRPGTALAPRVQILTTPDQAMSAEVIDLPADGDISVKRCLPPEQLNPKWAARSLQLSRAPLFVEPSTAPEWGAWEAEEVLEASLL